MASCEIGPQIASPEEGAFGSAHERQNVLKKSKDKTIWIDLDNSPHVPFFVPIIRELEERGYRVNLTARDAFQVCELADLSCLKYKRVGHHYGKQRLFKAYGLGVRTLQLFPSTWRMKPDIAVSHGSRSQMLAAATLRIPSIVILDYEFAKHLVFSGRTWIMAPEVIPGSAIRHDQDRVLRYPGIKEDVYVAGFNPDASIMTQLGLNHDRLIVIVRPPANEAHYHNPESDELFAAVIEFLSEIPNISVVLLPRNKTQEASARRTWPELFSSRKMIVPEHAVDGLNLIWHSDLVISGGGTMNREAAALGVPVYSIFRGHIGAVDRYLSDAGRLVLIESSKEVRTKIVPKQRVRCARPPRAAGDALTAIVDNIVAVMESKC